MQHKTYFELVELIEQQNAIIVSQSEMIAKLINENAEQENLISELMRHVVE